MKKTGLFLTLLFLSSWSYAQMITQEIKMPYDKEFDSIVKLKNIQVGEEIKVYTQFQVDDQKEIINVVAKGTDPIFEREAILILSNYLAELKEKGIVKKPETKYTSVIIMKIGE